MDGNRGRKSSARRSFTSRSSSEDASPRSSVSKSPGSVTSRESKVGPSNLWATLRENKGDAVAKSAAQGQSSSGRQDCVRRPSVFRAASCSPRRDEAPLRGRLNRASSCSSNYPSLASGKCAEPARYGRGDSPSRGLFRRTSYRSSNQKFDRSFRSWCEKEHGSSGASPSPSTASTSSADSEIGSKYWTRLQDSLGDITAKSPPEASGSRCSTDQLNRSYSPPRRVLGRASSCSPSPLIGRGNDRRYSHSPPSGVVRQRTYSFRSPRRLSDTSNSGPAHYGRGSSPSRVFNRTSSYHSPRRLSESGLQDWHPAQDTSRAANRSPGKATSSGAESETGSGFASDFMKTISSGVAQASDMMFGSRKNSVDESTASRSGATNAGQSPSGQGSSPHQGVRRRVSSYTSRSSSLESSYQEELQRRRSFRSGSKQSPSDIHSHDLNPATNVVQPPSVFRRIVDSAQDLARSLLEPQSESSSESIASASQDTSNQPSHEIPSSRVSVENRQSYTPQNPTSECYQLKSPQSHGSAQGGASQLPENVSPPTPVAGTSGANAYQAPPRTRFKKFTESFHNKTRKFRAQAQSEPGRKKSSVGSASQVMGSNTGETCGGPQRPSVASTLPGSYRTADGSVAARSSEDIRAASSNLMKLKQGVRKFFTRSHSRAASGTLPSGSNADPSGSSKNVKSKTDEDRSKKDSSPSRKSKKKNH